MVPSEDGGKELVMTNKFGEIVDTHPGGDYLLEDASENLPFSLSADPSESFGTIVEGLPHIDWSDALGTLNQIETLSQSNGREWAWQLLTMLLDRRYDTGELRRSRWLDQIESTLVSIVSAAKHKPCSDFAAQKAPGHIPEPYSASQRVVVDARPFPPEGRELSLIHISEPTRPY